MLQLILKNASEDHLTFPRPAPVYANAQRKISLEITFIYLGTKKIYCTFKTCRITSVLFS